MICPACLEEIKEGEYVQRLPPPEVVTLSKKSGRMYLSPDDDRGEIIHYACILRRFHPDFDSRMYDMFYARVEATILEDKFEELREEAFSSVEEDIKHLCPNCREERERLQDPDNPPDNLTDDTRLGYETGQLTPAENRAWQEAILRDR